MSIKMNNGISSELLDFYRGEVLNGILYAKSECEIYGSFIIETLDIEINATGDDLEKIERARIQL